MRHQPQGHPIPTDIDVWMVVLLLSQIGNPVDPDHRGSKVSKLFSSNQTTAFQAPFSDFGGFVATHLFHSDQTVRPVSSCSSFANRKFFAELWEQRSKGMPIEAQQPQFQPLARVVPKTVHRRKFFFLPCLTGFASVVRFVHRPY
jgi:hypothetical protein